MKIVLHGLNHFFQFFRSLLVNVRKASFNPFQHTVFGGRKTVFFFRYCRVDLARHVRHDAAIVIHPTRVSGNQLRYCARIHQFKHSAISSAHSNDSERDCRRNSHNKCLSGNSCLPLHILIRIILIVYFDDQLVVITIDVRFGAPPDPLTAIQRYFPVFLITGFLRIKGSRPDIIDMFDQFLVGSGPVQIHLDIFRDGPEIPELLIGVCLVKEGPDFLPLFTVNTGQRPHIGELVRKTDHPGPDILTGLQRIKAFLLAPLPGSCQILIGAERLGSRINQAGNSCPEPLPDLLQGPVCILHNIMQDSCRDHLLVVGHG